MRNGYRWGGGQRRRLGPIRGVGGERWLLGLVKQSGSGGMAVWKRTRSEFGEVDTVAELVKGQLAGLVERRCEVMERGYWPVCRCGDSVYALSVRMSDCGGHDGRDSLPSLACVKGPPVARLRTRPAAPTALDPARSEAAPESLSRHQIRCARPIRAARPARCRRVCHPSARLRLPPVIPPRPLGSPLIANPVPRIPWHP